MAELNTSANSGNNPGRSKKASTRIDLTAMVDLAFLLITFFILTTTLQKPKSMNLVMPDDPTGEPAPIAASQTMTVLLGANNKLEWYMGLPDKPLTAPAVEGYGKDGIRRALLEQSAKIRQEQGKEMIVLVKPSAKANYNNVVNMMDELNIASNNIRAIVKITPGEITQLQRANIYD